MTSPVPGRVGGGAQTQGVAGSFAGSVGLWTDFRRGSVELFLLFFCATLLLSGGLLRCWGSLQGVSLASGGRTHPLVLRSSTSQARHTPAGCWCVPRGLARPFPPSRRLIFFFLTQAAFAWEDPIRVVLCNAPPRHTVQTNHWFVQVRPGSSRVWGGNGSSMFVDGQRTFGLSAVCLEVSVFPHALA